MVSDTKKEWRLKGLDLILDKIRPRRRKVRIHLRLGQQVEFQLFQAKAGVRDKNVVFINLIKSPKIAKMPVKSRPTLQGGTGDNRHNQVSTVAGVP